MPPTTTPQVIVLDLDGTIVGDVHPQLILYDLHNESPHVKFDSARLQNRLRNGLLRPHFKSFLQGVSRAYGHRRPVEFFVYTASERRWANVIVAEIERVVGFRFNRPIFTRDQCTEEGLKQLSAIRPGVLDSLSSRYPWISASDLDRSMVMINNTREAFPGRDHRRLIVCPTYSLTIPEDVPRDIPEKVYAKDPNRILGYVRDALLPSSKSVLLPPFTYDAFQKYFYRYYHRLVDQAGSASQRDRQDRWWAALERAISEHAAARQCRCMDDRDVQLVSQAAALDANRM